MSEFDRNPGIVPPVPADGPPSDPAKPVSIHHGMVVRLRNYFLTGLVLVGQTLRLAALAGIAAVIAAGVLSSITSTT